MITHGMGVLYPGACTSIHMNMLVRINPAVDTATLTEAERVDVKEDATFRQFETGTQPCLQDTPSDHWIATVIRGQVGGGQEQSPAAAAAAAGSTSSSSSGRCSRFCRCLSPPRSTPATPAGRVTPGLQWQSRGNVTRRF
jgi:hypothetical protein